VGRHSSAAPAKQSSRPLIPILVAALAAVALVVTGTVLWTSGRLEGLFAGAEPTCTDPAELVVVADPSIAPVLTEVAEAFDASAHACVHTAVKSQAAADTAAVVAVGGLEADAWVPDSSVWVNRVSATAVSLGQLPPELDVRPSVATSPVVFAVSADQADELVATEPVSWTRVLGGTLPVLLPDPEASAASLAGLLALRGHAPADDPRSFAGAMIELGKSIPASAEAAYGGLSAASVPTVAITSEAQVARYNLDEPAEPLAAAYPSDGTVALDYPFLVLPRVAAGADGRADASAEASAEASAAPPSRAELVDRFERAVRDAGDALHGAGFRDGDGGGALEVAGVSATAPPAEAALDGNQQLEILRTWSVLTLRSRMLAVIDVSGSMEEPAGNGLRRIDVFQQAAGGALAKFSGEVELGVWVFSTARNGTQDWEDLAPIAPLADAAHTAAINGIVGSLPARLGGATGLYDTTLAAVQRVRDSYEPDKINSVLLITDGRNEDADGITLDQLLADLAAQQDPAKPVPVIMIGFGPDTDLDAMQRIAKATGGAAYSASKPEDLSVVLVDALSQRSCRPDC
jgi:hypothetical protein